MDTYPEIAIHIPQILFPHPGIDLQKWSVVACDQFTSQPGYWHQVEDLVGDAPSTLHLILPETYLEDGSRSQRIQAIHTAMRLYLEQNLFQSYRGMVLVERTVNGKTRHGLVLALDLEQYDFRPGARTLIRATEGTIMERLPPRIEIRQAAPLEVPHILVLIDDSQQTVIEPLVDQRNGLRQIYDFDLMLGGGHLTGWLVNENSSVLQVVEAFRKLADPSNFNTKYGLQANLGVLLFALGDGNHSFATAKAIWENIKGQVGKNHPARFAMVEVENIHDPGLEFEPIHRVLFNVQKELLAAFQTYFGQDFSLSSCSSPQEMISKVDLQEGGEQQIGIINAEGYSVLSIRHPLFNLPVGTLQAFLDTWKKNGGALKIDYVHGTETVLQLGSQPGNMGFYLPPMPKEDLFKTVLVDGALPRKTFSMGEAKEKRFYLECRAIT